MTFNYRKIYNIWRTLVSDEIVYNSDVVGAAPVCSNYILILDLSPGFDRMCNDKWKTRQEAFEFRDLVPLILETWRQLFYGLAHD